MKGGCICKIKETVGYGKVVRMVILINQETVVTEVMLLAKYKLADHFSVALDNVEVQFEIKEGKLFPDFKIKGVEDPNTDQTTVSEYIKDFWLNEIKPELIKRLCGLSEVRDACS